jgi:MFS family permease
MDVQNGPQARPPVPLILSFTLAGVMLNTLIAPTLPDIVDGLDASPGQAGLVLAAASLPGIALAPVIGLLADRFGRREVLLPSLVLFAVAGALGGLAPNFWVLVALRLAQGVGAVALISLAVVLIGDHWEGSESARIMGRNGAVVTVSLAVLPLVGGGLTDVAGWRAPFMLYLFALLPFWYALRRLESSERQPASLLGQVRAAWPYVRTKRVFGVLAAGVLFFLVAFGLILTVLPLYAESAFGLSASARGLLLALPALPSTLAALSLGRLVERAGSYRAVVGASALLVVAYATLSVSSGLGVLTAGILVYGLGGGVVFPLLQNLIAEAAPTNSRATLVAMWSGAIRIGQTAGPALGSAALGPLGAANTFAAGAVLAAVVSVVLARCLRPAASQASA